MKKSAFTIMEILLAMAIVGVIAGATMNSIKNITANKVKTAFQNNYNHMQRTIATIVSDETLYPAIYDGYVDGKKLSQSFDNTTKE